MTRFSHSSTVDKVKGSGKLNLLTSANCDKDLMNKCSWAVQDAVWLLKRAQTALAGKSPSSSVLKYANRYFLTPTGTIEAGDLKTIKNVLGMTLTGLQADTTMKVGNLPGLNGSVSIKSGASKSYHNNVSEMGSNDDLVMGAIKVSTSRISEGRLGVKTLIHEASHKFAGTNDYCYFQDDGITPRGTFNNKTLALENADSYCWFAIKIGRSWNPLAAKNSMFN